MAEGSLHAAARDGMISLMKQIMDADEDIDVDALDDVGWAPLHYVAAAGKAAAGAFLVEFGADVDVVDPNTGNTPLHLTGKHNKRLVTSILVWCGAELDTANKKGNTALHEAALANAKDVAWLIVGNCGEAAKNIANFDGQLPLDVARDADATEVMHVLATGEHID